MTHTRAILTAARIIESLDNRKGFEFGDIDKDIMDEIIQEMAEIIIEEDE